MSRTRQKQSSRVGLQKRHSYKFLKIHRKMPVLESFFKKRDSGRGVNFAKFLRISFLTEHPRWLLLAFQSESKLYSFWRFKVNLQSIELLARKKAISEV